MITNKFILSNLNCANCASKIESQISQMDGIISCNVNFVKKYIFISTKAPLTPKKKDDIIRVIKSIEPDVELKNLEGEIKEKGFVWDIVELAISALIFVLSIFVLNNNVLSLMFAIFAFLLCGYNIFLGGIKNLLKFKLEEKALMTIAAIAAIAIGDFAEGFAVIFLFRIGSMFEKKAVEKSRRSIEDLAMIVPDTVTVLSEGEEVKVPSSAVKEGDIVCVHPFERVCVDGTILQGSTSLDASAITGESLPVERTKGEEVLSGMINSSNTIVIKAKTSVEDSTAGRIIKAIEGAGANKSQTEGILTRFSQIYTPVVVALAVLLCTVPLLFGFYDFETLFRRSLVFLVSACPCAIVISIPLAFYSGIGKASKAGIIFKSGKYIESLSKVKAIAFDKTGTLTTGELKIDSVECYEGYTKDEVLKLAASVEEHSGHPIAVALTSCYKGTKYKIENLKEYPGFGVCAVINGNIIICGKLELLEKFKYNTTDLKEASFYVGVGNKVVGSVTFFDTIKENAKATILELKQLGIEHTAILSGDTFEETRRVAGVTGIKDYFSKLLPEDKYDIIKQLKKKYGSIAFVGDGINDTPSLALADCSVAMGKGSMAAMEIADLIFMSEDIGKLPKVVRLSRRVLKVIKSNVIMTLAIKALVLLLAAIGLAPMWMAVLADTGLTLVAVLNSTCLIKLD